MPGGQVTGSRPGQGPSPAALDGTWSRAPLPNVPQTVRPNMGPDKVSARPFDPRETVEMAHEMGKPDARFDRPTPAHIAPHPHGGPVPSHGYYRGYYGGYYCHPWYRYQYHTHAVVWFHFGVHPWYPAWIPPYRYGWVWVPGYWYWGWYHPGYWRPGYVVPVGYVYVPGWWETEVVYVEGYYRKAERKGWRWVDGHYLEDGIYVRGHWVPVGPHPEGYTWVPGFWNGDQWFEGFWRPEYRRGFVWMDGHYDENGIFTAGYWMPLEERPGFVWVPGWFDGNGWVEGYWVAEAEVDAEDPRDWQPEPVDAKPPPMELPDDAPLAMPVEIPAEEE